MKGRSPAVTRMVSGGQTGVDRAALDVARALGLELGGWCPRGRIAEDGVIPAKYPLVETESPLYWVRTEQNVLDSDATLILFRQSRRGGTEFTYRMAMKHRRPAHCVDLARTSEQLSMSVDAARDWLAGHRVRTLNVAGPRESVAPGIYQEAQRFLMAVLGEP